MSVLWWQSKSKFIVWKLRNHLHEMYGVYLSGTKADKRRGNQRMEQEGEE
jgi:hypothetical protein